MAVGSSDALPSLRSMVFEEVLSGRERSRWCRNNLAVFIGMVEKERSNGDITDEDADALVAAAQAIIDLI